MSRKLSLLVQHGSFIPVFNVGNIIYPSHLFYADDILIFYKASWANVNMLVNIFQEYGFLSWQIFNWDKSYLFFSKGISSSRAISLRA